MMNKDANKLIKMQGWSMMLGLSSNCFRHETPQS